MDSIVLGLGLEITLHILVRGSQSNHPFDIAGRSLAACLPKQVVIVAGSGSRIHQYQAGDTLRMANRVFQGQEATKGMSQNRTGFQLKLLSQSLDIGNLGFDADLFGLYAARRFSPPSLIVVDEAE